MITAAAGATASTTPDAAWPDDLFDYRGITPASVEQLTDAGMAEAERDIGEAAAHAQRPDATWADVLGRIDAAEGVVWDARGRGAFMVHVHTDPAVRDAGQAAEDRIARWLAELPLRDDINAAVTAYVATDDAAAQTGERRRLLERWGLELRRAGHGLPADVRAEIADLTGRIVELESAFQRRVTEWQDGIDLAPGDLEGLPDDLVASLAEGEAPGTKRVTLDYPLFFPFMETSPRRDLREALERKFQARGGSKNRELLEQVLDLRRRKAELLGYPSWAHYRIEPKMAGTPERVGQLHDATFSRLRPLADAQHAEMARRLEPDTGAGVLQAWDVRYYHRAILAEEHGVDAAEVAAHLPLDSVIEGLLALCSEVFGLRFVERDETRAWHDDVRLFDVHDSGSDEVLGWFYADLHPRPGKFGHAMAAPLRLARRDADGRRRGGISAIVANLPGGTDGTPALLRHDDVTTLFHEFGHVLHEVIGRNETTRLSMNGVEEDFPEAISQIMEHWAWHPDILVRIGRHHATGAPFPRDLAQRLAASRTVDEASFMLRSYGQFGTFDLLVHGPDAPDVEVAMRRADAVRGLPTVEGAFWPASFAHLVAGYDAGYYGYLWSKVYGDDLWSRFEAEGITSATAGAAYRRDLLEAAASEPAETLVERFLGRPSSNETFLRLAGIADGTT